MKAILVFLFVLFPFLTFANGDDCVDCGNKLSGSEGALILANFTSEELIQKLQCDPQEKFEKTFCTLLSVFEKMDDYYLYVKRCHPDVSLNELYGRAFFSCSDRFNRQEMGLLNHLAIRFPDFSTGFNDVIRVYRKQGRLEELSALLNKKDSQGRTFLDIHHEAVQRGEYFGTQIDGLGERPLQKACMLGGRFEKYPHPDWCKRKDKLFQ